MARPPISIFKDGEIHALRYGRYELDEGGYFSMTRLAVLKAFPVEYRTGQDEEQINEIQAAFRARKEYEERTDGDSNN